MIEHAREILILTGAPGSGKTTVTSLLAALGNVSFTPG
jgi:predicted ATPase